MKNETKLEYRDAVIVWLCDNNPEEKYPGLFYAWYSTETFNGWGSSVNIRKYTIFMSEHSRLDIHDKTYKVPESIALDNLDIRLLTIQALSNFSKN